MVTDSDQQNNKDGSPWWIKVITFVGVPSAICLFLVWFITQGITAKIDNIKTNVESTASQMNNLVNEQRSTKMVLQQICANTAGTNKDRSLCFQ